MDMFRRKTFSKGNDEENPYWMSFSDIMAGILIIFILVCCALVFKLSEMEEQVYANIKQLEDDLRVRDAMLREVKELLEAQQLYVDVEDDALIVPMSTLDFDSGSYRISSAKNEFAATALGLALHDVLIKEERWKRLETIFIEGHTDSVPADNRYRMGNWELSTLRAISLWKYWTEEKALEFGSTLKDMAHAFTRDGVEKRAALFSVSGYADTRRREMDDITEDQRRRNRRINIRFVTKQIMPEQLEKIRTPISRMLESRDE